MKTLLLLLFTLLPLSAKRVALIIGNDAYTAVKGYNLKNAGNDADAVAKMLTEKLQFKAEDIILDTDLTRIEMFEKIEEFSRKAQGAEVALAYFAGHGMEGLDQEANYMLPSDVNIPQVRASNAALKAGGVDMKELIKGMKQATPQGVKIVLMDCCRDRPKGRSVVGGGLLKYPHEDFTVGTVVMLAAAPGRQALDQGKKNGPFAKALLKHLPKPGHLLLDTLNDVQDEVAESSKQYGYYQEPWMDSDNGRFLRKFALLPGAIVQEEENPVVVVTPPKPQKLSIHIATKNRPFINSLGMKFVPVPITGGDTDGERVLFSIWETRSKDYAEFIASEGERSGLFTDYWRTYKFKDVPIGRGEGEAAQQSKHPVVCVSALDAEAFCLWLTKRERKLGRIGLAETYRLPTDHEWSCAVGLGSLEDAYLLPIKKDIKIQDMYVWGKEWPPRNGTGNYSSMEALMAFDWSSGDLEDYYDDAKTTNVVGKYKYNEYGIYDLGGNVSEWTASNWNKEGERRVIRGANWHRQTRELLLSSKRYTRYPDFRLGDIFYDTGFRCVLDCSEGD